MRLIYLTDFLTIVLCFVVWAVFQVSAALICLRLPDRFFRPDRFFFRTHRWERAGRIYDTLFRVGAWKHLLPDGAAVWKGGFKKKTLAQVSPSYLQRFLIESARGELSHWLALFPFWLFWLFTPPYVPLIMLVYALAVNLPCIIAQRYNRPRVERLLETMARRCRNGRAESV